MTAATSERNDVTGFVQVMRGAVDDRDELRSMLERWATEQAPHATGWLGSTAGVADDGTFVGMVRFASADDARRNSERPGQHEWWMETSKLFNGEVTFHDCEQMDSMRGGGSDDAGFVQIIGGRVSDVARMRELSRQIEAAGDDSRPDFIGGIVAIHQDGGFTMAAYFPDEESARRGEQSEPPAQTRELFEQQAALMSDLTYVDLRQPLLSSPR